MENPAKILSFDTATSFCTVAITEGTMHEGRVLASYSLAGLTHSRNLLGTIDMLMRELALDWQNIDGIAVGLGPGSFTGLRIGMATAKGLVMVSGLPLLGCSTLEIVAAGCGIIPTEDKRFFAVLDARKHEVYVQEFVWKNGLSPKADAMVLDPYDLARLLADSAGNIVLSGDGAVLYRDVFTEQFHKKNKNLRFTFAVHNQPQAATLGFLGAKQLTEEIKLDSASVVPLYIRKSDAELNLGKGKIVSI